jgi:triosephosphate isomerase (TIM)
MNRPFFYIANWKMYFSYQQTRSWLNEYLSDLSTLAKNNNIIICPSYTTLEYAAQACKKTHLLIGGQDCSSYAQGAHTGQISALSLSEIGCNYCLIGHSEQRSLVSNEEIEEKALRLIENNIIPILCISKSSPEQLQPALTVLSLYPSKEMLIAYEPIESIGTGTVPENGSIEEQFYAINAHLEYENIPKESFYLLYGGSVNKTNATHLKIIDRLDGFLIGGASTRFDEFTQIIDA